VGAKKKQLSIYVPDCAAFTHKNKCLIKCHLFKVGNIQNIFIFGIKEKSIILT